MVGFLKKLLDKFLDFSQTDDTDVIEDTEIISRYLLEKNRFSADKKEVKVRAYLPPPNKELSVYRTSDLSENDIWEIGEEFVARPQRKKCLARGQLLKSIYSEQSLEVIPDKEPHPRHAIVINWPDDKHDQQIIAIRLKAKSLLILNPEYYP